MVDWIRKFRNGTSLGLGVALAVVCGAASAQNFATAGQSWSSGWGFQSASDRSLALQQANAIRSARTSPEPSTKVTNNTTNYNTVSEDNRSNYQEVLGDDLDLDTIDFQLNGDRIGQNTNSVGSMNTGTTNIDVQGDANEVVATNAAETEGCVDGTIEQNTTAFEQQASPSGIDISNSPDGRSTDCSR
ncbi:MAG: hypothetical protein R6V30_00355 [Paracoccaceae bacterium]